MDVCFCHAITKILGKTPKRPQNRPFSGLRFRIANVLHGVSDGIGGLRVHCADVLSVVITVLSNILSFNFERLLFEYPKKSSQQEFNFCIIYIQV